MLILKGKREGQNQMFYKRYYLFLLLFISRNNLSTLLTLHLPPPVFPVRVSTLNLVPVPRNSNNSCAYEARHGVSV